jgi:hypothetical protein
VRIPKILVAFTELSSLSKRLFLKKKKEERKKRKRYLLSEVSVDINLLFLWYWDSTKGLAHAKKMLYHPTPKIFFLITTFYEN